MEREARCCNTYCLRVGVLWFYFGFREGPGGWREAPEGHPRHIRDEFKENQSNMQWNSIKNIKKLKKINWKCNEILFKISWKSFWLPHWLHFGFLWASSGLPRSLSAPYAAPEVPFVSIWLPFGSILPSFLVHFGSILDNFWCSGRVSLLLPLYFDFRCRFGLHFGSILEAKTVIFSMKNRIVFSIDFLWIFAVILGGDLHPNCIKNRVRNEKVDFMKMSVSCRRELDFQGPGPQHSCKRPPKID